MTLIELSAEYRESAELLKKREDYIKKQVKSGKILDNLDTRMRIKYLREERYQAISTANYLEDYYSFGGAKQNV